MTAMTCDFLVVGAGIIGLSIARELRRRHHARVIVIEKEPLPGQHASGRNSGRIYLLAPFAEHVVNGMKLE